MIVYMLRNNATGLFYRRMSDTIWVKQQEASIWTTKGGPTQAKSQVENKWRQTLPPKDLEIISFTLTENNV